MEGRAFRNSPVGCSSEGASLPRWTVTRRKHRAVPSTRDGTLARSPERSEGSRCKEGEPAPLQRSVSGGALFAVMVQILLRAGTIAVQA